jgi:hypothetical protein
VDTTPHGSINSPINSPKIKTLFQRSMTSGTGTCTQTGNRITISVYTHTVWAQSPRSVEETVPITFVDFTGKNGIVMLGRSHQLVTIASTPDGVNSFMVDVDGSLDVFNGICDFTLDPSPLLNKIIKDWKPGYAVSPSTYKLLFPNQCKKWCSKNAVSHNTKLENVFCTYQSVFPNGWNCHYCNDDKGGCTLYQYHTKKGFRLDHMKDIKGFCLKGSKCDPS